MSEQSENTISNGSMSCAADSPVPTSVTQGNELGSMGYKADFGASSTESFASYDPATSSWRTSQRLLFEDLCECLETLPGRGLMRNGELFLQKHSEHCIDETGSFSLPTIGKSEYRGASKKRYIGSIHFRGAKMSEGLRTCESDPQYLHPSFAEVVMGFPIGWTELEPAVTPSCRKSQNGSDGE